MNASWYRTSPNVQGFSFLPKLVFVCQLFLFLFGLVLVSECTGVQKQERQERARPKQEVQASKDSSGAQTTSVPGTDLFVCEKGPLEKSCQALINLYRSSSFPSLWLKQKEICQWSRFTCSQEKTQMIGLSLIKQNLTQLPKDAFSSLTSLQELSFFNNQLKSLPEELFWGLTSLQELSLGQNQLRLLPEEIFQGLTSLESLSLYRNELNAVPKSLFSGLTSLQKLSFFNNQLKSLPQGILNGLTSLRTLYSEENPLKRRAKLSKTRCKLLSRVSPQSLCPNRR